mgnify:CR=1 FL=1
MRFFLHRKRGFTLYEVVFVVAIIGLLFSVVIGNIQEGRKKARDAQRISDLAQIQLSLRMYRDSNSSGNPIYASGDLVGDAVGFDADIASFVAGTIRDPLNQNEFRYYYDSEYTCDDGDHVVLVALTLEQERSKNWEALCGGSEEIITGVTPSANSYVVILR